MAPYRKPTPLNTKYGPTRKKRRYWQAIEEMRERFHSLSHEIILPFEIGYQFANATITIPQRGDKRNCVDLSEQNVKQYRFDRLKRMEKFNPEQRATKLLKDIQNELKTGRTARTDRMLRQFQHTRQ